MFEPSRCPYFRCSQHLEPSPNFFRRHGHYAPICRPHPVPRFRCKACRRTFSRQTFRMDYRDHRPDLNARLFQSLASGIGLRQSSRNLRLSLRCTELKFRKIARHLRRLNLNLRTTLPEGSRFQLDELETYEGRRNGRPLSVPVVIERGSRYIVWAESATIRIGSRPRSSSGLRRGESARRKRSRGGRTGVEGACTRSRTGIRRSKRSFEKLRRADRSGISNPSSGRCRNTKASQSSDGPRALTSSGSSIGGRRISCSRVGRRRFSNGSSSIARPLSADL